MTDQEKQEKAPAKNSFLTRVILVFAVIIAVVLAATSLYSRIKPKQEQTVTEQEVIGLDGSYSDQNAPDDLSDLTVNEMRERGSEFIYQMLIKNQAKIEDLYSQLGALRNEVLKYRSQEKIGRMIVTYIDLREKIFAGKNGDQELKSLELLSASDEVLTGKLAKIHLSLEKFATQKKLKEDFAKLIPELIFNKKRTVADEGLLSKIRRNISRLVVLRRIDGKDPTEIDATIVRIEKFLNEEKYQDALGAALSLPQSYHNLIKNFLDELNASLEVKQTDQEILNYLKSLN